MAKENNEKCIEEALALMYAVPITPNKEFPFICSHPFTTSTVTAIKDEKGEIKMVNLVESEEDKEAFLKSRAEVIKNSDFIHILYALIEKPYKMFYLKCCKKYLSNEEFSDCLREVWVLVENPNDDVNVPLREIAKWFETADKKSLMVEEDYKVYSNLPDEFDIYRGVSVGRNPKGFSWTRSLKVATWFANRFGKGYVQKAHIRKEEVLAYFNTRNEDEYIVNSFNLTNIEKIDGEE